MSDNGYQKGGGDLELAQQIAPHLKAEVDPETGSVTIRFRGPAWFKEELEYRAWQEGITLTELLTRAANLYLVMDISGLKPGSYYELHEPGESPKRLILPFWPWRREKER